MKKLVKPRQVERSPGACIGTRLSACLRAFSLIAALSLLSLGSQAATQLFPGVVKREFWAGKVRADVLNGTAGAPTSVTYPTSFEGPVNVAENYAQRISGVFIPPTTGDYVFFIAADDDADLFLSTDANPANKKLIAQETGWSGSRSYNTVGGGSTVAAKRSDQFPGTQWATAGTITLTAGTRYYIEGVQHEGGGGDNLEVYAATKEDAANGIPANGDPSNLTGDSIGLLLIVPTTFTFSPGPANTTAAIGTVARFSATASTDTDDVIHYQWRRNGVNIPNATGSSYAFIVGASDNGAKFDVVATLEHFPNTATSTEATLTVPATGNLVVTGKLKLEFFQGGTRGAVENGTVGAPTRVTSIDSFETPSNYGANFAQRVSGYFIPAVSGNYNFIVNSDDDSDLFLSTDENPSNKRLIAQQPNWSAIRTWATDNSDGSGQPQKRSNTWVPDTANPPPTPPYADGIPLVAGQRYYIEGVQSEGGGGDNFAATFHLASDPVPEDGTASALTGPLIAYSTSAATTLTITTPPADVTVTETFTATFNVAVSTDSAVLPTYQWRRNGANIPGATSSSYTLTTAAADNQAKFSVAVAITGTALTATSSEATLTVRSPVFAEGFLKREFWQNQTRATVLAGTAGNPNSITALSSFEAPSNVGSDYAQRVSGFIVPPADGDYVFFLAADDDADLFLSTDANPANKKLIARESGWSAIRSYNTVGGGSNVDDKRSDSFGATQWTDTAGEPSNTITLKGGTRYYIEAVQHEGGGGDNLAVYMSTAEDAGNGIPANGDASNLRGAKVGFLVPPADITITTPPASVTITENRAATFTAAATTTSQFGSVGYQWQRNGVNIPGATGASYTAKRQQLANNGDTYRVVVQAPGTLAVTSTAATLTVIADTVAPIAKAGAVQHKNTIQVGVQFDETVTTASAGVLANYTLSAGTVAAVRVIENVGGTVYNRGEVVDAILDTTGLVAGGTYTLTVKDVADVKGNKIASQAISFKVPDVKWASVGSPVVPAAVAAVGDDGYDVISGGRPYWGTYDEITFVYKEKTGNFDVKTQVIDQDFNSQWGRGGLAVREATDEDKTEADVSEGYLFSAYREIHANPNQTDQDPGPNNNPNANNNFEANQRVGINYGAGANDTSGWGGGGGAPTYPDVWLRLTRVGDTITGYRSVNGTDWTQISQNTWTGAPATLLVGPAFGPENGNITSDPANFKPYMTRYRNFRDTVESTPKPMITSIVRNANGSITLTWTGGGVLETTPAFTGGTTTWTAVDGAASPFTFTPPAGVPSLFGRIRVP
jgi:hypothetical protein